MKVQRERLDHMSKMVGSYGILLRTGLGGSKGVRPDLRDFVEPEVNGFGSAYSSCAFMIYIWRRVFC